MSSCQISVFTVLDDGVVECVAKMKWISSKNIFFLTFNVFTFNIECDEKLLSNSKTK